MWDEWEMCRCTKDDIMTFPEVVRNVIPEGQQVFYCKDNLLDPGRSAGYLVLNLKAMLDELRRVLTACKLVNVSMDPTGVYD